MENFTNTNHSEDIQTESIQAGFLEDGDIIIFGDTEFEVVDSNNQHKNGSIKIKDKLGEVSEINSFNTVERVQKESL